MRESRLLRRRIVLGTAFVPVMAVAGCGQSTDYAASERPPAPITVSAAITRGRVQLSPTKVGGGPVTLTIANLTRQTTDVKIEPVDAGSGRAQSGPISPQGTASMSLTVQPGSYSVSATGARSADLTVGAQRKSSQNQVGQP